MRLTNELLKATTMRNKIKNPNRAFMLLAVLMFSMVSRNVAQPYIGSDEKILLKLLAEEKINVHLTCTEDKLKVYYNSNDEITRAWQLENGRVSVFMMIYEHSTYYYLFLDFLDDQIGRTDPSIRRWEYNDMIVTEEVYEGQFALIFLTANSKE